MNGMTRLALRGMVGAVIIASATFVQAQQVTGVPGSPSATTTLQGNQLPPAPPKFGGVINESAVDSKPWWPPRVVPPKGAPNILLIMSDDQGYGVSGTFGGVIPTPAAGPHREGGAAVHAFQLHGVVLPHARGTHHRPQPSRVGLRHHHRAVDGFPGL